MFQPYPLHPSPVAALRRKNRLSITEGADRLGMPLRHLRVLEASTQVIPRPVLAHLAELLAPPANGFVQLSLLDVAEGEDA